MEQNTHIQALIKQLSDSNSDVRSIARHQLVDMGPEAVEPLIEIMTTQSGRASWEAAKALAYIHDSRCLPIMKTMLLEGNPIIGQTAVNALINYQPDDLATILMDALNNTHQVVKLKIIESIGELNQVLDPQPLIDVLSSTDSASIRYTIIDAFIKLNIPGDYQLVLSFADDPDRHVQQRVERYKNHFGQ